MIGMNKNTGKEISTHHLSQSVYDILTTPIGSRIMRRTYGSKIFELIDSAYNKEGELMLISAIADAIMKWEPRIKLEQVKVSFKKESKCKVTIIGSNIEEIAVLI